MSCHTALEYCSQPLSDIWSKPSLSQPFCLFCDDHKLNRMLCEREMVSSTKDKMRLDDCNRLGRAHQKFPLTLTFIF